MTILIVSSYLPFPLFSGGAVRLFNLIKELSKNNQITLVCEKRDNQTEKDIQEVSKFCEKIVTVKRKKQWSFKNIINSAFSSFPFLLIGHTSMEMKSAIVSLLAEKHFDVIHVETFYVNQNLPKTYIPIVLCEHNIEYLVYDRFLQEVPFYLRPLLALDIAKIKYWEEKFWKNANSLIAVSDEEKKYMQREDVVVVPNGVNVNSFPFNSSFIKLRKKEKRILFIGDFKWLQNQNAATFILKEIWPRVRFLLKNQKLDIKLWIVGKNIPESIKALGSENVIFDENAPDETAKIYSKAFMLLAPIKVGGGTSYKILEAMASGVPVVTTALGVVGLKARNLKEALVAETLDLLAENVVKLLKEKELYENLAKNARSFIEKNYTWEIISKTLESVYKKAII